MYRRLNWWQKNQYHLEKHHPELATIWQQIEGTSPTKAAPDPDFVQPNGLNNVTLLPFQVEGLSWMMKQEKGPWKGGMLADEMGMGKTLQSIALILSDRDNDAEVNDAEDEEGEKKKGKKKGKGRMKDKKLTLVIAPTVALMWKSEIEKFTTGFKVNLFHGAKRGDADDIMESDIVLTSYAVLESAYRKQEAGFKRKGSVIKEESPLHQVKWHRIILDECHNIKDRACNTAKGAFALDGEYRWCLSGTPLQNRVGELYSLIRFLGVDPFAFYYCKVCDCKSLHWRFSDKRSCDDCHHTPMQHICFWNNDILKPIQKQGNRGVGEVAFEKLRLLLDRMMLRRTKVERADDLGLPPRVVEIRRDFFTEEEEELYTSLFKDIKRNFATYVEQGTVLNNYSNIFSLITKMRQMADHPDMVLKSKTRRAALVAEGQADDSLITCRICLDEAEEPIMSSCRHIFCRECIRQYLETAIEQSPECPTCHQRMTIDLDQDPIEDEKAQNTGRQGMLSAIDPSKWRTSTKIEALVEELSSIRTDDHTLKSLVFSQFTSFLDLVERRLLLAGYKVARLQGHMTPQYAPSNIGSASIDGMPHRARANVIKYFDETPECTVFLISLKAGGVALNLTSASRVYIMDPWWNPAAELQAMDRIHRLGQHRPILVKRMVIENSIESKIIELQKKKESMVGAALGDDDKAMGRLTPEDLRFLFTN
ncbi:hypothetical protein BT69DRAFT_444286 [Atractiella rhizophila]|nr:hypothetical protein BT69DRAFT_444286 [Atractiella rhizophila]